MKKIITIFVLLMLLLVGAGCNSKESNEELIITNTNITVYIEEEELIIYEVKNKTSKTVVKFESDDLEFISLSDNKITALKEGNAIVKAYLLSKPNEVIEISVVVIDNKNPYLTIENMLSKISILESFEIKANVRNTNSKVIYETSDENIISVKNNVITGVEIGNATINIYLKDFPEIKHTFNIEVIFDPVKVFETLIIDEVLVQNVTTFGENPKQMEQQVLGSVCRYLFKDVTIIEQFAPIDTNKFTGLVATEEMLAEAEPMKLVRPGIYLEELKYIVYHDTGNAGSGADAKMHADYMVSSGNRNNRARSWHYTVDDKVIYYQVPNNEVTWQGDSYDAYAKSIGIETCVNYGADLYRVWQNTARLMSSLLIEKGLNVSDIRQHYDMSGKNCPQTLRYNKLYDYAISLIEGEVLVQTLLKDYEITFESLNPEYLDNTGKVIKLPNGYMRLAYKVTFTKGDEVVSKIYYSDINGKCKFSEEEMKLAEAFDDKVVKANLVASKENEQVIEDLVNEFYSYSDNVKQIIGTKNYLFNIEKELFELYDSKNDLMINEVYIDNNISSEVSYSYIELYNKTNNAIDLSNYKVIVNDEEYVIVNGIINPKSTYLIAFANMGSVNNQVTYFPIPDSAYNVNINSENLTIVLKDSNNALIDKLGINNVNECETESFKTDDFSLSITRKHDIDTNNNLRDFASMKRSPVNSNNESIEAGIDENVFFFDWSVVLANKNLSINDEEEINNLVNLYDMLSDSEKAQSKKKELLDELVLTMEGIKNPSLGVLNKVISQIPSRIVNDYKLPEIEGVSYEFVDVEGKQYYNISTGQYLKVSYEAKLITMIAYYGSESKEFTVNFGLAEVGDKIIYNTGAIKPSGGNTSDGYGTYNNQLSYTGFGGVAIRVAGKIFFIGKNSLIELDSNTLNTNLTKTELRPYGGVNFINNCGLVNGVAREYSGTGALYYNSGDKDLTFDLSDTYGRNNNGAYGYFKVIFSKNSKGEYYVSSILPDSGSNTSSTNYQVTLKPGEYLWCPHTYETNSTGGTWLMNPATSAAGGVLVLNEKLEIIHYKNK